MRSAQDEAKRLRSKANKASNGANIDSETPPATPVAEPIASPVEPAPDSPPEPVADPVQNAPAPVVVEPPIVQPPAQAPSPTPVVVESEIEALRNELAQSKESSADGYQRMRAYLEKSRDQLANQVVALTEELSNTRAQLAIQQPAVPVPGNGGLPTPAPVAQPMASPPTGGIDLSNLGPVGQEALAQMKELYGEEVIGHMNGYFDEIGQKLYTGLFNEMQAAIQAQFNQISTRVEDIASTSEADRVSRENDLFDSQMASKGFANYSTIMADPEFQEFVMHHPQNVVYYSQLWPEAGQRGGTADQLVYIFQEFSNPQRSAVTARTEEATGRAAAAAADVHVPPVSPQLLPTGGDGDIMTVSQISKLRSQYANNPQKLKELTQQIARARAEGRLYMDAGPQGGLSGAHVQ